MCEITRRTKSCKWLAGVFVSAVAFIYLAFTLLRPYWGIIDIFIIFMWPPVSGLILVKDGKFKINSKRLIVYLITVSIGSYVLIGIIAGLLSKEIGIAYRGVICGEMMVMYAANLAVGVHDVLRQPPTAIQDMFPKSHEDQAITEKS